jgi:hypothetical protein
MEGFPGEAGRRQPRWNDPQDTTAHGRSPAPNVGAYLENGTPVKVPSAPLPSKAAGDLTRLGRTRTGAGHLQVSPAGSEAVGTS